MTELNFNATMMATDDDVTELADFWGYQKEVSKETKSPHYGKINIRNHT